MRYSPQQIMAAIHGGDTDLARYYLGQLEADELRGVVLTIAARVPTPLDNPDAPENIISAAVDRAARAFGTSSSDVISKSKRREPTEARQVVAYVARLHGMSLKTIGMHLYRDHTTIMHAVGHVGETPRLRRIATNIAESLGWTREAAA